jgi:hypothetical protein
LEGKLDAASENGDLTIKNGDLTRLTRCAMVTELFTHLYIYIPILVDGHPSKNRDLPIEKCRCWMIGIPGIIPKWPQVSGVFTVDYCNSTSS